LDALTLVLRAWGIGPGDEVIVPGHTFIATWLAVTAVGATPVPVDPDPGSYCIDAASVARAITNSTRAVIPVHLYGRPAPMEELVALARTHDLRVLEDAAQAHGATLRSQRAGVLGDAAAFSFYPAKNLGALGDGGMVTTQDGELADRLRALRNYGGCRRYEHEFIGSNSRLDELQAAFLRAKLPALDSDNEHRARIAARYLAALDDIQMLTLPPADTDGSRSSWHLFVVRHTQRDRLAEQLAQAGIATQVHYPRAPHLQAAYSAPESTYRLPISERLGAEVLSLPIGPTMTDTEVDRVIAAVSRAARSLT
jgi:dTDP-4-amino-4,6-dideoxygalactose transaminase